MHTLYTPPHSHTTNLPWAPSWRRGGCRSLFRSFHTHALFTLTRTHAQVLSNTTQTPLKFLSNTSQTPLKHLLTTSQTQLKHLSNSSQILLKHLSNTFETLSKHLSKPSQTPLKHLSNTHTPHTHTIGFHPGPTGTCSPRPSQCHSTHVMIQPRTPKANRPQFPVSIHMSNTFNTFSYTPQNLLNTSQIPFQHLSNTTQTPLKFLSNTSQTPLKHLSNTFPNTSQTPLKHPSNTFQTLTRHTHIRSGSIPVRREHVVPAPANLPRPTSWSSLE